MGKHIDAFEENEIDVHIIEQLSDAELLELGVSLSDRKRLRSAVGGLSSATHTQAAPQPCAAVINAWASSQSGQPIRL